jgi:hypothetical protein
MLVGHIAYHDRILFVFTVMGVVVRLMMACIVLQVQFAHHAIAIATIVSEKRCAYMDPFFVHSKCAIGAI